MLNQYHYQQEGMGSGEMTNCRKIAVANQKGGVGKTTTTLNLGAALAKAGRKVLVIDGDPQGSLTAWLGFNGAVGGREIGRVLSGMIPFSEAIRETNEDNLWAVPTNHAIVQVEQSLTVSENWERLLKRKMEQSPLSYDYILFDCPAAFSSLLTNYLTASDEVIIPVQTEIMALNSTVKFLEKLAQIRRDLNPSLKICGILPVMYDGRTRHSHEILKKMREAPNLKQYVFSSVIRKNVRLTEAPSRFIPILKASPSSYGSIDYLRLAAELIAQEPGGKPKAENLLKEVPASKLVDDEKILAGVELETEEEEISAELPAMRGIDE
ncbi:MAG: AAA family ATPase [candidate division Zixibacteria bacterium]|nr:AAA family ATPase [candidate division Zixibacteria bacterium]